MVFKAQKDITYGNMIWSMPFFPLLLLLLEASVVLIFLSLALLLLAAWIWNSTEYVIDGNMLRIKCWLFKEIVPLDRITSIKRTKNILASYALAVDRLEIGYSDNYCYVSPVEKEKFIQVIMTNNKNVLLKN